MNVKVIIFRAKCDDYNRECRLLAMHCENQRNELMLLNHRYKQLKDKYINLLNYMERLNNE